MAEQQRQDEAFADDMALIEKLVRDLRLHRWPGDPETVLEVGDLENTSILAIRHGLFTFETTSRGRRSIAAVFSSARDARRYLIMDLVESFRFHTPMAPVVMHELAPGTRLEDGPTGHRLSWPGGEATFYQRDEAVTFSWVIDAAPTAIVASYGHVNGEPLFDLGITAEAVVTERPPARIMDPPPIESPPPDEEAVDHATIDGVLAELGWERRPAAGAGRRFLLLELGGILRMRRRLPRIRLNRLAPACAIEKGPTAFELSWAEGQATFPTGYIGHQHALDYSWVVTAELADIAASYRHPNGEPLFDLGAGRA
jgi:hypothetical protein